jgi:hypothetical protein
MESRSCSAGRNQDEAIIDESMDARARIQRSRTNLLGLRELKAERLEEEHLVGARADCEAPQKLEVNDELPRPWRT